MKIFSNEDIRAIDRYTIEHEGVSSLDLIERVAEGVAAEIMRRWHPSRRTAIFAGPGNNGADALAVARILIENGWKPDIFLFNIGGNKLSADCRACRDELLRYSPNLTEVTHQLNMPELSRSWLVIDGLFGSGLRDVLPGGFQSLVRTINDSGAIVVSIDTPSGLFADWNMQNPQRNIIHATLTIAIQFPRLSFMLADNGPVVGEWTLLDIHLSDEAIRKQRTNYFLVEQADVHRLLRPRNTFSSKADYGSMLLVSGSYGMMGAAVLAAKGALRAGVGKLTVQAPRSGFLVMQTSVPEALFNADKHEIYISEIKSFRKYTTVAVGPGLGVNDITIKALENFLAETDKPVVLDADALNCIAKQPQLLNHVPRLSVLTPHAAEFDRIFGKHDSAEARLLKAIEVSRRHGIIIVLKGHFTATVRPDGMVYFNSSGTPALATAGSGDTLTGIIGSLMAQGYRPELAAVCGAFIHGVAGEIAAEEHGEYGVTASDIAGCVGLAINRIMLG